MRLLTTCSTAAAASNGSCNGSTTLPARNPIRRVRAAIAASSTAGAGYGAPNRSALSVGYLGMPLAAVGLTALHLLHLA